jgi:hypothetical protein
MFLIYSVEYGINSNLKTNDIFIKRSNRSTSILKCTIVQFLPFCDDVII